MASSNNRIKDYDTVHHITSRIAHRVFFLGEEEQSDLVEIIRRAAEFCGIRLLAWCVLTNHFHLLVHLPPFAVVVEAEVLRRYGVLKGRGAATMAAAKLGRLRQRGEKGAAMAEKWLDGQRKRMQDVGAFMKIVKQWFTEEYNRRKSHCGTLWESAYHDTPVEKTIKDMSKRMAYVHLNPIRAAVAAEFDSYGPSSFTRFVRGDAVAESGMRFVYDDYAATTDELQERHEELLMALLEEEKLRRAEEIARKRAAGYKMPADSLTSEAMIAQAAAHLKDVQKSSAELREGADAVTRAERRAQAEGVLLAALKLHPDFSAAALAEVVGVSVSGMYGMLRKFKARGVIEKHGCNGQWIVKKGGELVKQV